MARGPVSLQLHKLSFCTTATLHAKMLWEHLSGDIDMFAVFDHVKKPGLGQSVSEKQIVRLIRHGNLLVGVCMALHVTDVLALPNVSDTSLTTNDNTGRDRSRKHRVPGSTG